MCDKNLNEIANIVFAQASDESNWNTNSSEIIFTTPDGNLRLTPQSAATFFERNLGNIDASNNRLRIGFDFSVFREGGSSDTETTVKFSILKGNQIIGSGSACLSEIENGQKVDFHLDRTFQYETTAGAIKLRIEVPDGFGNVIDLRDIKVEDFNFCDDDVRNYFIFDDFFKTIQDSTSAAVELKEWKIAGVETLTTEFFAENQNIVFTTQSDWKFASADIDGDNRVEDNDAPQSFNPFAKAWGLSFLEPVPFYGGKPTGTETGSDYGLGILNIGLGKPQILNEELDPKDGAIFIDIDFTKDLEIVLDLLASDNSNPYDSPKYYRRYYIEWDVEKCEGKFYFENLSSNPLGSARTNQIHNGFLYGITDQNKDVQVISCQDGLSFSGNNGVFSFEIDFGTDIGMAGIDYNAFGVPDKFSILWNNQEVSSGFVGSDSFDQQLINAGVSPSEINTGNPSTGSGSLLFNKTSALPSKAIVTVEAPLQSTGWNISGRCPQAVAQGGLQVGLGDCDATINSWQDVFVDTTDLSSYNPSNGDVLYTDAALTSPFNGFGQTYRMRRGVSGSPLFQTYGVSFDVSNVGVISNRTDCSSGGPGGSTDPISVENSTSDDCNSCWSIEVTVPAGETRQVQFISNFASNGLWGGGLQCNLGTTIISDQIVNITETTTFSFGIDASKGSNTLSSNINVIVRDGGTVEDQQIFTRTHDAQNC